MVSEECRAARARPAGTAARRASLLGGPVLHVPAIFRPLWRIHWLHRSHRSRMSRTMEARQAASASEFQPRPVRLEQHRSAGSRVSRHECRLLRAAGPSTLNGAAPQDCHARRHKRLCHSHTGASGAALFSLSHVATEAKPRHRDAVPDLDVELAWHADSRAGGTGVCGL